MYFTFTNPSERQNRMSLALPLKKIYHLFTVYRAPSRVQGRLPGSWIYNPEVHTVMPSPPPPNHIQNVTQEHNPAGVSRFG